MIRLTLWELWRVVVDVREGDFNLGGARQPTHVTTHVFGLDDDVVLLAGFAVHVRQGRTNYTWMDKLNIELMLVFHLTYLFDRCSLE